MRCSHCQQCACTASNAHVQLQAIEYLNISGLVIDFATSPVRTGNSFFYDLSTSAFNDLLLLPDNNDTSTEWRLVHSWWYAYAAQRIATSPFNKVLTTTGVGKQQGADWKQWMTLNDPRGGTEYNAEFQAS